jgi:A/G-specific adenine glycosylase
VTSASTRSGPPLARALLRWYDQERRDLPWRRSPSAYGTLVSELMLQQTVVATVIPYYQRFLGRFPDLRALAAAEEDEVLAHWSGLGYYSRGRNLHRAARQVLAEHGGELPVASEEALQALPGVGAYTAAAIAAIAGGVRTFALDGNAARVMARLTAERRPIDLPEVKADLRAAGQLLVPAERPGDFAQAVMELGARVCVPRTPRCGECPVIRYCRAREEDVAASLPARTPRRPRKLVEVVCVAAEREGRVLLVRRPRGLLGGTWLLPAVESGPGDEVARALEGTGVEPSGEFRHAGAVRHVFTHRDVTARVVRVGVTGALRPRGPQESSAIWVHPSDPGALALSSFTRKTLALLS